ncbi:zinc ribbon domain-containing protein [Brevibacillus daliensis]|uniref:zinc ribbon domain-containing protein n=1 Tax=Brevibacillus daliensis TaxID=2892995 RepID=UPI001E30029A|nr:zinc ribbon domain-containing protein [Brevibacillus daliensis]
MTLPTFCQSCSMPLGEAVLGTEKDQSKSKDYCIYCYKDGAFTYPDCTMEQMIEICVPHMIQENMDDEQARAMLLRVLPNLKRWENQGATSVDSVPEPRIEHLDPIVIAGISARTTNACEMSGEGVIGNLWEQYAAKQLDQVLTDESAVAYGVYYNYENGALGEYSIMAGKRVSSTQGVPEGLDVVTLPKATYAVFTTRRGPLSEVVIETWQDIWKWSMKNGVSRTFTGDFERYDERCMDPANVVVDIYIAIATPE